MPDLNISVSDLTTTWEDVGQNRIFNGNFEFAPGTNVACGVFGAWLDGTSGGSATNTYGWRQAKAAGSGASLFSNVSPIDGTYSLKASTTATASSEAVYNYDPTSTATKAATCIPCLSSTSYTLTYKMSAQLNSGAATTGAVLTLYQYTSVGGIVSATNGTNQNTTTAATPYTIVFTTGSTARFFGIALTVVGNDGTGTLIMDAWFDDITLALTTPNVQVGVGVNVAPSNPQYTINGVKIV